MGDSAIVFDSTGAVAELTRIFYNKSGWPDSTRAFDPVVQTSHLSSWEYQFHGDTLIESEYYDGKPSSETIEYASNDSGLIQKQLWYTGDTLVGIVSYDYNQGRTLRKQTMQNLTDGIYFGDSVVYDYDEENHLTARISYHRDIYWDYLGFEHDEQGRVTKVIFYETNSTTQKTGSYAAIFHFAGASTRRPHTEPMKGPGIRLGRGGELVFMNPSAYRTVRIYDAKGALLTTLKPENFNATVRGGLPAKAYFIKAVTKGGAIVGKRIGVR
jgi:hypothetical protein